MTMTAPPPPVKCAFCHRLMAASATRCPHCGKVVMKRRPDPIREALVTLMGRVLEIKGQWTESIDNAMQQGHQALGGPDHAALMRMANPDLNPPLTCVQFLEHARDSMDAADGELQAANKLASGMASLLLLDMIRETATMAARIRAIISAAKDAEGKFHIYCEGDGSWLRDAAVGLYTMNRSLAVVLDKELAQSLCPGGAYFMVPVGQSPEDAKFERDERAHNLVDPLAEAQ